MKQLSIISLQKILLLNGHEIRLFKDDILMLSAANCIITNQEKKLDIHTL